MLSATDIELADGLIAIHVRVERIQGTLFQAIYAIVYTQMVFERSAMTLSNHLLASSQTFIDVNEEATQATLTPRNTSNPYSPTTPKPTAPHPQVVLSHDTQNHSKYIPTPAGRSHFVSPLSVLRKKRAGVDV